MFFSLPSPINCYAFRVKCFLCPDVNWDEYKNGNYSGWALECFVNDVLHIEAVLTRISTFLINIYFALESQLAFCSRHAVISNRRLIPNFNVFTILSSAWTQKSRGGKTKPNLWLKGHSQLVNDKTIFMGIKIVELNHTRIHTYTHTQNRKL